MPVFGVAVTTPATNLFGSFTSQSQNSTGFFSSGGLTGGATSSDFASDHDGPIYHTITTTMVPY
jgi:hypothetical protein